MKKILFFIALFALLPTYSNASEVGGTINTGVSTGIEAHLTVPPTASPISGTYTSTQNVALSASGSESIRYSLNTSDVLSCTSGTSYSSPIAVSTTVTIRAIACYGGKASTASSFAYVINTPAPTVTTSPSSSSSSGSGDTSTNSTIVTSDLGKVLSEETSLEDELRSQIITLIIQLIGMLQKQLTEQISAS